jgi:putative ABC transport system permease protein
VLRALELAADGARNLARHKLRSLLTALGVIFGVASVLAMIAVGEGARREILAQIERLGTTNIIVNTVEPPPDSRTGEADGPGLFQYGLTFRDASRFEETLPAVVRALPVHDREAWIDRAGRRLPATLRGVEPAYLRALRLEPALGRLLTDLDGAQGRRVCVVRENLLRELRYTGDPLRLDLRIGGVYFRVVGVLPDDAFTSPGGAALGYAPDANIVYAPFDAVVDRFGVTRTEREGRRGRQVRVELSQILCVVDDERNIVETARAVGAALATFHETRDYDIVVPLELLESRRRAQRVFNVTLPIIAGVSLLVGGIGILNIMLASVMERTAEIGVRRAVGATRADIIRLFLAETVMLALFGGVAGLLVGAAAVRTLGWATGWSVAVPLWSVALSLAVACGTGVIFGVYPARRAAYLEPVDALRHA